MISLIEKQIITNHCSDFLNEVALPIFKNLPNRTNSFEKVKVRHKPTDFIGECFNEAFADKGANIYNRGVFACTGYTINSDGCYYVFPVNGYRFLYSKEITNIHEHVISVLTQINEHESKSLVRDLLRLSYIHENLISGIQAECEIVFYNIPFFYAIRKSEVTNYERFLEELKSGSC